MKLTIQEERPEVAAPTPTLIVLEAIVRRRAIAATYNRKRVVLAPHILYTRHDALHVDAITVSREAMVPRETKIGTFRLEGLAELRLTDRSFEPSPLFDRDLDKYAGETLMAVEAD